MSDVRVVRVEVHPTGSGGLEIVKWFRSGGGEFPARFTVEPDLLDEFCLALLEALVEARRRLEVLEG
jgi:hypothetical protein